MIDFDPYSMDFHNNPYPVYKQLRDEAPVFFHEQLNIYVLSRYADVLAAHKDNVAFSSAGGVTIEPMAPSAAIILTDDPAHRAKKSQVTKVFTRSLMESSEPFIRKLCHDLLDKAEQKDSFDFVQDFAVELPLTVISEMIGIPEEFRHDIHYFANMMLARGDVDPVEVHRAMVASNETYSKLIAMRRATPSDDVVTLLMNTEFEDEDGTMRLLTDDDLISRFMELAIAGHETVSKALPNGMVALQQFPSERKKLLEEPSLIPNAVEEILRFDPPSQLQGRTTTRDVEFHGVTIPKGFKTMLLTGAATRDERKYENPDIFDVTRKAELASIYFGFGIHKCLGIHLARLEMCVALEVFLQRFPEFEVYPEQATRVVLSNVRGMSSLPCKLKPDA